MNNTSVLPAVRQPGQKRIRRTNGIKRGEHPPMKLGREFYTRPCLTVAKELIGKQLVHNTAEGTTKGIIVETEAYIGPDDAAAHSYKGRRTQRTEVMYGNGGYAYIYTIYGLHCCMNVVAHRIGYPEAVLIRALQPTAGLDIMRKRRGTDKDIELCRGPGKLCSAMGITMDDYGEDLCADNLYIEALDDMPIEVMATKRININYSGDAADYPWRFVYKGSRYISVRPRD